MEQWGLCSSPAALPLSSCLQRPGLWRPSPAVSLPCSPPTRREPGQTPALGELTVCCSQRQVCFSALAYTSVLSGTGVFVYLFTICFIPFVSLSVFCSGSHSHPRLVTQVSPPTEAPRRFPLRLPLFLHVHWPSAEHSSLLSQCHPSRLHPSGESQLVFCAPATRGHRPVPGY